MNEIPPTITDTAFNCPHCRVLAHQSWYNVSASYINRDQVPSLSDPNAPDYKRPDQKSEDEGKKWSRYYDRIRTCRPYIESSVILYNSRENVPNIWFSRCFKCEELAIWVHDQLVYPDIGTAPPANEETPEEIRNDYDEASTILNLSPRGAAAILRLAIQKLCVVLGKPGVNLNADIATMVSEGLDIRVQRALDAMRVIGNEAVHPGQIDLRDDRNTAITLFRLFNLIVEKTIAQPKHIDDFYNSLPEDKRNAIAQRDAGGKPPRQAS